MSSKAVLATDRTELQIYQERRQKKLQDQKKQEARLHALEQDVAEIKTLLKEIVAHVKSNQSC